MHLADARARSDLGLGEVVIDPQADDPALAGGQRPHRPLEQVAVFGGREARLLGGEHATGREALAACVLGRGVGLDERLGISYLDPYRDERGWAFSGDRFTDTVNGFSFLKEAYDATVDDYEGRVTVPVLWDKESGTITSNESADLMRIFNDWAGGDLYPPEKRGEIDETIISQCSTLFAMRMANERDQRLIEAAASDAVESDKP